MRRSWSPLIHLVPATGGEHGGGEAEAVVLVAGDAVAFAVVDFGALGVEGHGGGRGGGLVGGGIFMAGTASRVWPWRWARVVSWTGFSHPSISVFCGGLDDG